MVPSQEGGKKDNRETPRELISGLDPPPPQLELRYLEIGKYLTGTF